jgi:hypothetical protein
MTGKLHGDVNLYAAVDPAARYCESKVAEMRFAALLTPFRSEADALVALKAAGAAVLGGDL